MKPKITLDANILHDLNLSSRPNHECAKELWRLFQDGFMDIAVTSRIEIDIPDEPLKSKISNVPRIPTVGRDGYSKYDIDYYVSDEESALDKRLQSIVFPGADPQSPSHKNRLADIDHLLGHRHQGNDVFVTAERSILSRRKELSAEGIDVMTCTEVLEYLKVHS